MKNTIRLSEENFQEVKNILVTDENNNEPVQVANKVSELYLQSDDEQDSFIFVEFDNETTIQCDRKGQVFVSSISLKDEIELYLQSIIDNNYMNNAVWGENAKSILIEKFPNLEEMINDADNA